MTSVPSSSALSSAPRARLRLGLRLLLAALMSGVGLLHFVQPAPFVRIMPAWLPAPLLLVYVSGVFEILGGVGLLIPATRKAAAWGLIALYIAVFPANVSQALRKIPYGKAPLWLTWARLPLQAGFIAWAYALT